MAKIHTEYDRQRDLRQYLEELRKTQHRENMYRGIFEQHGKPEDVFQEVEVIESKPLN